MNKQELIDNYIINTNGIWQDDEVNAVLLPLGGNSTYNLWRKEFETRAKELGWINGYKWGVEYPVNGKKPDLPDDLTVQAEDINGRVKRQHEVGQLTWVFYKSFRIVDERYKPVDAELVVNQQLTDEQPKKDISDSSFALSDAVSALIDAGLNDEAKQVQAINKLLLEMHATRKAKAEKKRVVASLKHDVYLYAINSFDGISMRQSTGEALSEAVLNYLYDKGFLILPEQSK